MDCHGAHAPRNDSTLVSKPTSLASLRGSSHLARSNPEKIKMKKQGYVYILFNKKNGTLYVGVTSNLIKRIYEHKNKLADGFTKKYDVDKLGYFEVYDDITIAIEREKQLKAGNRQRKIDLIEKYNKEWKDLYNEIVK